ncbi:MAG TPA: hypothetical protein VHZ26_18000 [Caulobacteraceae bacterium]|jgi:hypothetical protein|nr:hypothetical protein [Caulobacteraceae bacterium]
MIRTVPALALFAALVPLHAATAPLSGQYGPLLISVQGDLVTGALSQPRVGNGSDAAPQFSCAFQLAGHLKLGKAQVVTWYADQTPTIAGVLTLDAGGAGLQLKDNQPGCAMSVGDMVDQPYQNGQDNADAGWIGTRLVAVPKAIIVAAPNARPGRTPYVVQDDAVAVLAVQGDWIKIAYPGPTKLVQGWVKASELSSATPPATPSHAAGASTSGPRRGR